MQLHDSASRRHIGLQNKVDSASRRLNAIPMRFKHRTPPSASKADSYSSVNQLNSSIDYFLI
ncbi:hypothetical protein BVI434_800010 [Burkholderia vietnamiensis]|nr:hypothetical protein BVI434_800010 [Burkholderia vietnamiensis]